MYSNVIVIKYNKHILRRFHLFGIFVCIFCLWKIIYKNLIVLCVSKPKILWRLPNFWRFSFHSVIHKKCMPVILTIGCCGIERENNSNKRWIFCYKLKFKFTFNCCSSHWSSWCFFFCISYRCYANLIPTIECHSQKNE